MKQKFTVLNMNCKHCQQRVETMLKALPGATGAKVNLAAKTAVLTAKEPISRETITAILTEAGYQPVFGE
mgnify:CR=1 FL=1